MRSGRISLYVRRLQLTNRTTTVFVREENTRPNHVNFTVHPAPASLLKHSEHPLSDHVTHFPPIASHDESAEQPAFVREKKLRRPGNSKNYHISKQNRKLKCAGSQTH